MRMNRSEYIAGRELVEGQRLVRRELPVGQKTKPFPLVNVLGIILALTAIVVTLKEVF